MRLSKADIFTTAMTYSLLLIAVTVPTSVAVAASLPAISFTATTAFNNVETTTLGWSFTVNSPIWVSALGYYDYSADPSHPNPLNFCCSSDTRTSGGLLDNHIVGIFDVSGTLLASTTVPSGTVGTLIGDFRYAAVPAIALSAGQYYVEATQQGTLGANPTDPVVFAFSSFSTLPEITVGAGVDTVGGTPGTLTFSSSAGGYQAYIGPNFLASDTAPSSTIPEPGSFVMLGSGLLLVAGGALRRARRR